MAQVPNKNIDNASGQVVRLDIQNTLKAVATHNFGARNDAGTILPCEFLADDTSNKLLIRKSSGGDQANPNPSSGTAADFFTVGNLDEENLGLLPKAGGTMTGQLLGDDGSGASSPAYAFDGDTDTGMFRNTANSIQFATAGIARITISSTGINVLDGKEIRFQDSSGSPFVSLKSASSLSSNRTFTLPTTTGSPGQFLAVSSSNHSAANAELQFTAVTGVPVGSVFCIAANNVPSGYLKCNGDNIAAGSGTVQGVNRSELENLRNLIGNTLPDLRGEFVRGFDDGRGVDSGRSINESQGSQIGDHDHGTSSMSGSVSSKTLNGEAFQISETFSNAPNPTGVFSKGQNQNGQTTPGNPDVSSTGTLKINASHDHTLSISGRTDGTGGTTNNSETRPRNVVMLYIIKF
tara:strand:- start:155 stop:1375 length:1221 start_codon:yes stop_codon:yes gene_type:complete